MRKKIQQLLENVLKAEHLPLQDFTVEATAQSSFGDFSTNLPFRLAKILKRSPQDVALWFIPKLASPLIEKVEAMNGYMNFFLQPDAYKKEIQKILKQGKKYGSENIGKGKKIQIEFISANPTGPVHMGNGRGGFLGDCLGNVLSRLGYKVTKEYYINDYGNQTDILAESVLRTYLKNQGVKVDYAENLYQGDYIQDIARSFEMKYGKLEKVQEIKEKARKFAVEQMIQMIKSFVNEKLGICFDVWFSETSLYEGPRKEKVLKELEKRNLTYEKDGALWFRSTLYGDDKDRVIRKSDSLLTYFFSDILLFWNRVKERKFKKIIQIWGADHHGYVPRVRSLFRAFEEGERADFILVQLVRLMFHGKMLRMSKRKGVFLTLEELIDDIGLDVARFFFLNVHPDSMMDFDLELARKHSHDNPVFYVQYAHARIASILRHVQEAQPKKSQKPYEYNEVEKALAKKLMDYASVLKAIEADYGVSRLPQYTYDVARRFHDFYEKCRVISDDQVIPERLHLIEATKMILKDALSLMGITAPEAMTHK